MIKTLNSFDRLVLLRGPRTVLTRAPPEGSFTRALVVF